MHCFVQLVSSFSEILTSYNFLECFSKLWVTVRVDDRVQCTVKISQPETKSVEFRRNHIRFEKTEIEDNMKWDPANEVGDEDVR